MYDWGYEARIGFFLARITLPSGIVCAQLTPCMGKKKIKTAKGVVHGSNLQPRSERDEKELFKAVVQR